MPLCNPEAGGREGRPRNRGAVRVGKGTGGTQEQSLALTKPPAQKKTLRKSLAALLHALLHRALFFC